MSGKKSSPVRQVIRAVVDPVGAAVSKWGGKKQEKKYRDIHSITSPVMSYLGSALSGDKGWKHTTMGRWFTTPSIKMPESKGSGSAQAVADASSEKSMMAAKEAEKKRLRAAAGRSSLIKTSGRGVLEPADTKKKKLLGE